MKTSRAVMVILLAADCAALPAADPVFERAWNKLERIESGQAKPGSVITFSPEEINAWAGVRVPQMIDGVREPRVELGINTATGSAMIDFVKVRQSEGTETNPILAMLLQGERPVTVAIRLQSSGGRATVSVNRVEIGGLAISGALLDFLIKAFLLPMFPEAKIDRGFELRDNIDRIEIRSSAVRVVMKR